MSNILSDDQLPPAYDLRNGKPQDDDNVSLPNLDYFCSLFHDRVLDDVSREAMKLSTLLLLRGQMQRCGVMVVHYGVGKGIGKSTYVNCLKTVFKDDHMVKKLSGSAWLGLENEKESLILQTLKDTLITWIEEPATTTDIPQFIKSYCSGNKWDDEFYREDASQKYLVRQTYKFFFTILMTCNKLPFLSYEGKDALSDRRILPIMWTKPDNMIANEKFVSQVMTKRFRTHLIYDCLSVSDKYIEDCIIRCMRIAASSTAFIESEMFDKNDEVFNMFEEYLKPDIHSGITKKLFYEIFQAYRKENNCFHRMNLNTALERCVDIAVRKGSEIDTKAGKKAKSTSLGGIKFYGVKGIGLSDEVHPTLPEFAGKITRNGITIYGYKHEIDEILKSEKQL